MVKEIIKDEHTHSSIYFTRTFTIKEMLTAMISLINTHIFLRT